LKQIILKLSLFIKKCSNITHYKKGVSVMSFGEKYSKCYSTEEFKNYIKLSNSEKSASNISIEESSKKTQERIEKDFEEIRKCKQK